MISRIAAMRRRREQAGFTLIELLVVIAILGILSAVVVFAVKGVSDKGKSSAESFDERTLRTAEEAYCSKFGTYGTAQQLVDKGLLQAKPTLHEITLLSGGNCGESTAVGSAYSLSVANPTAEVNVAANQDQWVISDTGSGPGYHSAAFAYTLNANVYDPLIIIGSDYSLQPGLAVAWEQIPTSANRATFTSALTPAAKPLPTHDTYVNAPDRPYNTTTWRFHLRQGVTFHDGSAFDADDVIWTWRDRQPINAAPLTTATDSLGFTHRRTGTADRWDSVEKIDQFTVDFTPKAQNLRLPEQIGHPKGAIVPMTGPAGFADTPNMSMPRTVGRHFDGSTGGLPANTVWWNGSSTTLASGGDALNLNGYAAEGTGPFKLISWSPTNPQGGGGAVTEINLDYWGQRPNVKRMNYTFIADATQRTSGLLSGQYDMAIDLDPLAVSTVNSGGGHVVTASYGQNALIYVNKVVKDSPGSLSAAAYGAAIPTNYRFNLGTDPAVRKAVSLAIDRTTYVNTVYAGNAAPGRWMAPPGILGSHQSDVPALAFNQAAARTALDTAGWTCGGGAPGAGTACAANETRTYAGTNPAFTAGRLLRLYLIGTPDIPQTGYDFLTAAMEDVGIDLVAIRYLCNSGATCALGGGTRGNAYNGGYFDLDLELPNQNDANPAFLPTLRFACTRANTFRFAPADGTNGVGPAVADATHGGTWPFGNTPCTSPGAVLGAFDNTHVPAADNATNQDTAQAAAAQQLKILVGQNDTNVVIPVTGQFRIYGMRSSVNLGDPHPSQTSQRWVSLTKSSA